MSDELTEHTSHEDEDEGPRRSYGTIGGRHGHSAVEALEQAGLAAEHNAVAALIQFPLMPGGGLVKLVGFGVDGRCTFSTEVSEADALRIREVLGLQESETAAVLAGDGMSLPDAAITASILSTSGPLA